MPETLTAPVTPGTAAVPATPAVPAAPATPAPVVAAADAIAAAGHALKAATSWGDTPFTAPTEGMAVTDGTETDPVADPTDPTDPSAEADAPEFTQNAQGQWHRPDGTFANAEEIAAIEAQIAADAAPPAVDPATAAETTPEPTTVKVRTRDGSEREIQVDDPELAQLIQQNFNDGMRRREYTEKLAETETLASEFREFRAMLAANPEGVILQYLPAEKQVSIAAQLLAQHFDQLVPIIRGYDDDPSKRLAAVTEAQRASREQETQFQTLVASQRQAAEVKTAVSGLIPDSATDEQQQKFWKFASLTLTAAVDEGKPVNKDTVPALLRDVLALSGFDAAGSPATPKPRITAVPPVSAVAPTASASSPVATPANDAAKQLAAAQATQKRIRLTQRHRTNAAAIPPAGAGAAPLRLPPVPPGATIEEAARSQKSLRSWTS